MGFRRSDHNREGDMNKKLDSILRITIAIGYIFVFYAAAEMAIKQGIKDGILDGYKQEICK